MSKGLKTACLVGGGVEAASSRRWALHEVFEARKGRKGGVGQMAAVVGQVRVRNTCGGLLRKRKELPKGRPKATAKSEGRKGENKSADPAK